MEILTSPVAPRPISSQHLTVVAEQKLSKQTKMAMMSQFLGFMLDAYDMALVLVMAPVLIKVFVSPKGRAAWQYIIIVFTYSITMASRPIGSAIFGRYADKIGRRFLLVLTIGGVGIPRRPRRHHHGHWALGLSQPSQQCSRIPVYLPRRA